MASVLMLARKRRAGAETEHFRRRFGFSKIRQLLYEDEDDTFHNVAAAVICGSVRERKQEGPIEQRSSRWWDYGYHNWTDAQFKRRLRVNRDTFSHMLNSVRDLIERETTRFKEPGAPEVQLALTLYRLAHGCGYTTIGDLFGVAPSTACQTFNEVTRVIVQVFYDEFVTLPSTDEERKDELTRFLQGWSFPCIGAWDGFHIYISSNLKNFYNFKKRYSVTNMGLVGANKRFLWAGVGVSGSVHDSTLLKSSPIFNEIESGHVIPNTVLNLPGHGDIPLGMVGDNAFPARSWLLKAYPDTTKDRKERNYNRKLRSARVVSEHAYGMLKGRWRIVYKKTECRRSNVKAIIMACIALHNLCIKRSDPCLPRWQLKVERLNLIRKTTKRTQDKQLSQEVRGRIKDWLWSLAPE